MRIEELNDSIVEVCPIDGINSDGVIWFKPEATDEQKIAAQTIMEQNIALVDREPSSPSQASINAPLTKETTNG